MNNSKTTRKALLSSVVALMLCFSMFIGTTMAWFTDTASTGVNTIKAGTLDIDLLMDKTINGTSAETDYESIAGEETGIFTEADVATNSNATLWEPGKTQVAYLAIKNDGNLAAKYSVDILAVKPSDATADMTKVMKYAITPDATEAAPGAAASWTTGSSINLGTTRATEDVAIGAGATHYFALSVHMDEEAGNEYQGQSVEFYISVTATQNTVEADSFGTTYDEDATYEATLAAGTATAEVKVTGEGVNKVVTVEADTTVAAYNAENSTTPVATVTVPEGTKLEDEAGNISVKVTPTDLHDEVEVTSEQGAKTYDVEVTGVKEGEKVKVELYVGTGLTGLKLYHEGEEIIYDSYNAATGIVTFTTDDFSPYTVVYNAASDLPCAIVDTIDIKEITATAGIGGAASPMTLDVAYQFNTSENYEAGLASPYAKWHADFAVKASKDVPAESLALAGYYYEWCQYNNNNWVALTSPEVITANTEIRLVQAMGGGNITVNYEELCHYGFGNDGFRCGAVDLTGVNEGTTLTVELRLYEVAERTAENNSDNTETGKYVTIGTYTYTF